MDERNELEIITLVKNIFGDDISRIYTPLLKENINSTCESWSILHLCAYQYEEIIKKLPADYLYLMFPIESEREDFEKRQEEKRKSLDVLIKLLIQNGADVNLKDMYGRTPIYFVSNELLLDYLIKQGAIINPANNQVSPLHVIASLFNRLTIGLIKKNANPGAIDKYGRTPLHCAAAHFSQFQIYNVRALVNYSPNSAEIMDQFGFYPLCYALMFSEDNEIIELFLRISSLDVLIQAQRQILSGKLVIPNTEDEANKLLEEFKIYDKIYNVPPQFKLLFGGAPKKAKVKNNIREKIKQELKQKAEKQNYEILECNGFEYYINKDDHGNKHTSGSKDVQAQWSDSKKKRELIKNWGNNNTDATFNSDFATNYLQALQAAVISIAHNNASSNFVKFKEVVGWDRGYQGKGEETNIIELYYGEDGIGSHIRPKAESMLKNKTIIDVLSEQEIKNYLLQIEQKKQSSTSRILDKINPLAEVKEEEKFYNKSLSIKELIQKGQIDENSDETSIAVSYEDYHLAIQLQSQLIDEGYDFENITTELTLNNSKKMHKIMLDKISYATLTGGQSDIPSEKLKDKSLEQRNEVALPAINFVQGADEISEDEKLLYKFFTASMNKNFDVNQDADNYSSESSDFDGETTKSTTLHK